MILRHLLGLPPWHVRQKPLERPDEHVLPRRGHRLHEDICLDPLEVAWVRGKRLFV